MKLVNILKKNEHIKGLIEKYIAMMAGDDILKTVLFEGHMKYMKDNPFYISETINELNIVKDRKIKELMEKDFEELKRNKIISEEEVNELENIIKSEDLENVDNDNMMK